MIIMAQAVIIKEWKPEQKKKKTYRGNGEGSETQALMKWIVCAAWNICFRLWLWLSAKQAGSS